MNFHMRGEQVDFLLQHCTVIVEDKDQFLLDLPDGIKYLPDWDMRSNTPEAI